MRFNYIKKYYIIILLYVLSNNNVFASFTLTDAEKNWLQQHPVIKLCTEIDYAPIEFVEHGVHKGMTSDYYDYIGDLLNVRFEYAENTHWSDCMRLAEQGEVDVVTSVKKTPERSKILNFIEPYESHEVIIIAQKSKLNLTEMNIKDLYGKTVSIVKSSFYEELLPKEHPKIRLNIVNNTKEGMIDVAFGRSQAFFASLPVASYHIEEYGIVNLKAMGATPYHTEYASGVRKDLTLLPNILQKAFDDVPAEKRTKIYNKWIHLSVHQPWYNKTLVKWIIVISALFVSIISLWVMLFKRAVKKKTKKLMDENIRLQEQLNKNRKGLDNATIKIRKLMHLDELTKLPNHIFLKKEFNFILKRKELADKSMATFMVSLDNFKLYTNRQGDLVADKSIIRISKWLEYFCENQKGILARYDQHQFVLFITGITYEDAILISHKICLEIEGLKIPFKQDTLRQYLTVSVGHAWFDNISKFDLDEMLDKANNQLELAKTNGKNTVAYQSFE